MSEDKIKVTIIGAGLGGLAAALSIQNDRYQVTVVEAAAVLAEVGAGVQITPQTVRSFKKWGIHEQLEPHAAKPVAFVIHRYSDGKVLAEEPDWKGWQEREFGAAVWDLHRADMQTTMYNKAKEIGVAFRFGCYVTDIDCENGSLTLKSGEVITADLLVGADGIASRARQALLGREDPPLPTGDLAYRIVLNEDEVPDPEMREMMTVPACRLYAGPGSHVIMYSLKGGKQMNIVLLTPDNLPAEVKRQAADLDEMMALFADWDPLLRKFLGLVKGVDKWRLMHHGGLETWHHPKGKFVMMGDAVHPMLPYLAQGANSAVEDGVVLGNCLHKVSSRADLPVAVKVFEALRKPRSERVVKLTHQQRHWNHLENGPEQEERDALMAEQMKNGRDSKFPSAWINPELWGMLCSFSPDEEVDEKWESLAKQFRA